MIVFQFIGLDYILKHHANYKYHVTIMIKNSSRESRSNNKTVSKREKREESEKRKRERTSN